MDFLAGEPVDVLTAAQVADPYSNGDTVEDWSAPSTDTYDSVAIAPAGSSEPLQDARDQVDGDYDLYFPADARVTYKNRVVVRGEHCDVVGAPALWRNPFTGWSAGLVVRAKLRVG